MWYSTKQGCIQRPTSYLSNIYLVFFLFFSPPAWYLSKLGNDSTLFFYWAWRALVVSVNLSKGLTVFFVSWNMKCLNNFSNNRDERLLRSCFSCLCITKCMRIQNCYILYNFIDFRTLFPICEFWNSSSIFPNTPTNVNLVFVKMVKTH